MKDPTCEERVAAHLASRLDDLRELWAQYTGAECENCDGTGEIENPDIEDEIEECPRCFGRGSYDSDEPHPDLGHIYEYGLSFDYVAPDTFDDQEEGYFRYQISYGGPSEEFRIFADQRGEFSWSIYRIEFWFLDWFDGASRRLYGADRKVMDELLECLFIDCGAFDSAFEAEME